MGSGLGNGLSGTEAVGSGQWAVVVSSLWGLVSVIDSFPGTRMRLRYLTLYARAWCRDQDSSD